MKIKTIASGSSGNCYHISDGKTELLLEAGIPIKKIMIGVNFDFTKIKGCLVSHSHGDHAKACKDLMKKGIDVYTGGGTIAELGLEGHRIKRVKNLTRYEIGSYLVMPFDVNHDTAEPYAFWIKSMVTGEILLFITDTFFVKYDFDEVNYLMIECNYDDVVLMDNATNGMINKSRAERTYSSHMALSTVVKYISQMNKNHLKNVYLLHLSDANSNETAMKEKVQKLTGVEVVVC